MTEEQWLQCADPELMVQFLDRERSPDRWTLFACHCCSRIWPLLVDDRSQMAVIVAERKTQGIATVEEIQEATNEALLATLEMSSGHFKPSSAERLAAIAARRALTDPFSVWKLTAQATGSGEVQERLMQARLLRDLFGNPFRSVILHPIWRTPAAVSIAEHLHASEDFREMPVLADALEDAGCTEELILAHCRQEEYHVRGCWVVNAVLGKEI